MVAGSVETDVVSASELLKPCDTFIHRHIGPSDRDVEQMLAAIGVESLDTLIDQTIPADIRLKEPLKLGPPRGEHETLAELRRIAEQNQVHRSLIGMGYHDCIVPPIIQRNILENPGWYTQYTPYQAEIAQGRLEALLNFQTMVADLTGLPLANASLLDEATAAAEAMTMCLRIGKSKRNGFFIADDCHPQTIAVVQTRAEPIGIETHVGPPSAADFEKQDLFGVLLQYPTTDGRICDYSELTERAHAAGALVVVAADLLALTLIRPPGEFGADIAVGNSQRFGVPPGFGGPHAAFIATRDEYKRTLPGRIVGVSKDAHGDVAYRLAIQTREQHIRREKATSNICTAQVLLAIMAGMYAVYHGPRGLHDIAWRIHQMTALFHGGLQRLNVEVGNDYFFDTLRVRPRKTAAADVLAEARRRGINLRDFGDGSVGVSFNETCTIDVLRSLWQVFGAGKHEPFEHEGAECAAEYGYPVAVARSSEFLTHPVFNSYHAEHEMLRYLHRLQGRDLSLAHSMIPLGSCTMKLNSTSEMLPVTWPEFAGIHPFAPADQTKGYALLFEQLERWLAEITGFAAVSLQPNAGAQGEYAGLLAIRAYHAQRGQARRDVCLIPVSAHGTNPASAVMAGYRVLTIACDDNGNIDVADLKSKAQENAERLAALMITYPSTHGVFEESVREICEVVHANGGQVYMDGANMNAQLGLCRPGDIGADVCHLNLHKTFCIPHGGGGPGMGPIAVAEHLSPFLPGHPFLNTTSAEAQTPPSEPAQSEPEAQAEERSTSRPSEPEAQAEGRPMNRLDPRRAPRAPIAALAAAPYGSAGILPISWMYIAMMGEAGLKKATQIAILNANYMAKRLAEHYPVLYTGKNGRVAHEFIIDLRGFKKTAAVEPEDVAKRLMDFGFHAPTMSFPVPGTLMIEPTESESKPELDRFCDALIAIRQEIRVIENGGMDRENNPLKNAPHTAAAVSATVWNRPYPREQGAWPAPWLRDAKFWPPVARIDNVYGDRHLFCTCPGPQSADTP